MKNKTFKIRLSDQELKLLHKYSKQNGQSASDYIRTKAIGLKVTYETPSPSGAIRRFKTKESV